MMVQREVADRFFAAPGTKAYGAVSVLVQLAAERTGFHAVLAHGLRPPPNVDSALVAFRRRELPEGFADIKRVVEAAFAHRRKTLPNSLELAGVADRPRAADALARLGRSQRPAPRRSNRRSSSSWNGCSRERAARPREDQPRPGRRPDSAGRQARGDDRAAADRARRPVAARAARAVSRRGLRRRHAHPARARAGRGRGRGRAGLAGRRRQADPGRRRPRRGKLRRRRGAPARERDARPARTGAGCTSSPPSSVPTCRSSSPRGRSSARATAPR